MNVVLLCRVSTPGQDYSRQVNELTQYCQTHNWNVVKVFTNKVSGIRKNDERPEIVELLDYVKNNDIDKVCVLEISRLGRNTLEALKVIQTLNEHGVCLFIKNYNIETITGNKVNPISNFLCTILLEIAEMERQTIIDRMSSGRAQYIQKCRKEGIQLGRPATYRKSDEDMRVQYSKEIGLLKKGVSLRNSRAISGTSITTIRKLYKYAGK